MSPGKVFDAYAHFYDLLYQDKDYGAEARYAVSLIRKHAPQSQRILELGCGTGGHAEHFARAGFTVDGVDISESMLARAEARRAGLPVDVRHRVSFSRGDIRHVRMNKHYDAVVLLFHVMSYQITNADVQAAFATAAEHLKPNGLLLFDFWYGPAVLLQRPEVRVKRLADYKLKVTRIAEPTMRLADNVVVVAYDMFIEVHETGKVEQVRETHNMRYFFLPELSLIRAGLFEELATHSWMSDSPLTERSWAGVQVLSRIA